VATSGEICDDGNVVDGDGCDSNCTATGCGNTIVTAGEACDTGPSGSATCDPDCTLVSCGDGTTNPFAVPTELCDDGNVASGDGCDANCTLTACGNGVQTGGEACDDGNLVSGDGCDSNCTPTVCGNGILTVPEQCDDGNLANADGCDGNCTATGCGNGVQTVGEACDDGNLTSGDGCDGNCTATACGNGIITAGEQCDDGNLISNDGCDANCTAPACGNGVLNPPEQCDDGNVTSADGCDANCTVTACGNGVVTAGEVCDDGNAVSGDGCDLNCTTTACGNGILTAGEVCDDGNVASGDGCRANCTVEVCGDGIVDQGEACDDGNLVSGDGCDATCVVTGCGNGVVTAGEQCDDGNLVNGDACSSNCQRELLNPVPAAGDRFGAAVAAAGINILVGVPLHDQLGAINTGLAYLYSGTTFQPVRIFENPTPDPGDEFGFALTVVGPNILIGAPFDATAGVETGAIHYFNGVTGALIRTIVNPDPNGSKHFGWAMAAIDANNVVISAPKDDVGLSGGGVAYLYNINTGSLQQVYLNPTPSAGDEFGFALSVAAGKVVIGAPGHDIPGGGFTLPAPGAGAVYIYDAVSGALLKTVEDPGHSSNDRFGQSVAALGADPLVGAPYRSIIGAVYRINATTGMVKNTYLPPPGTVGQDQFGTAIAVAGGDKVVVGAIVADAPPAPSAGAVHMYNANTATFLQTITKAAPAQGDEFGRAITTSGTHIVVGAPQDDTVEIDAGAVYFFPDNSCGNGIVDPAEQCDDDNLVSSDGCDANCTLTTCGNGIVTSPEQCDDGNNVAGDGCSPICGSEGACGDGITSSFEECDDGNVVSGDGCDSNCTFTGCGNGIVASPEQCDNGPGTGSDLCCSLACQRIDADGDTVCDRDDVCPNTPDATQSNVDGDIFGDACDICPGDVNNDSDNDHFCIGASYNPPALGGGDACSRSGGAGGL
jgi:cysteine-rich repeat protein